MGRKMRSRKEMDEVIAKLWASVDQAQIMDIAEYAFRKCPYREKRNILKELYDYAAGEHKLGILNPGVKKEELRELLDRAERLLGEM